MPAHEPCPIRLREKKTFRFDVDELASLISDPHPAHHPRIRPKIPLAACLATRISMTSPKPSAIATSWSSRTKSTAGCIFEGEHYSIMSVPGFQERTILLDGFSKTYAMTGWRLGYGVMRTDLATQIARLMTNSNSCTASFTQIAGVEAIRGDQASVARMRTEFQQRRDVFVAGLNRIKGFSCRMPKGAFYAFPNITKTGWRIEEAVRSAVGTGRRGVPLGSFVWRIRRRLYPLQRGQFAGKP